MTLIAVGVMTCAAAHARELTLQERVEAQRAIEQVYWSHRIWPQDNPGPKPPLAAVMSDAAIREKVEGALRASVLLDTYWHRPLRGEELQSEVDRMARETKSPAILRELFGALGNDPFLISECLARPALAQHLAAASFASDERIHGAQRAALEARLAAVQNPADFGRLHGEHGEMTYVLEGNGEGDEASSGSSVKALDSDDLDADEPTDQVVVRLPAASWDAEIARLDPPGVGRAPRLIDEGDRFVAFDLIARSATRVTVATVAWPKLAYDDWVREQNVDPSFAVGSIAPPEHGFAATDVLVTECTYDTWTPTSTSGAPAARQDHTAVWTGAEMIIWGGQTAAGFVNTGGRYDPATNSWIATSTAVPVPSARSSHSAVWTGTVMIVWGGQPVGGGATNTGGRYNPAANTWSATSTGSNVPPQRHTFACVWSGSEMIVWGGFGGVAGSYPTTGGRYNPAANTWLATSLTNVPAGRYRLSAVWAGSEMIVWGGSTTVSTNTGGRYNPATDSWLATSTGAGVPVPSAAHSAVWTGSEMIVFHLTNTSLGRYTPSTDSWISSGGAPGRSLHSAVWTGFDMIVWGGRTSSVDFLNTGKRYVPATSSYTPSSLDAGTGANVPAGREAHTVVFTGSADRRMIVWGGLVPGFVPTNTGGIYCAAECSPNGGACPATVCTTAGTCVLGDCSGTLVDCSDADSCTDDACSPTIGCIHTCRPSCPGEILHIAFPTDKTALIWDHADGGTASVHDLLRGRTGQFPVGTGEHETCVRSGISATTASDGSLPPVGVAFWYDVRGRHPCGVGPYGSRSNGTPRTSTVCP